MDAIFKSGKEVNKRLSHSAFRVSGFELEEEAMVRRSRAILTGWCPASPACKGGELHPCRHPLVHVATLDRDAEPTWQREWKMEGP